MNKLKYIIWLVTAVLWMASASAQTFYYHRSEKVPLVIQPGRKAVLSDNTVNSAVLPKKGDKLIKSLRSAHFLTTIYEETDQSSPLRSEFIKMKANCSVYDCYYVDGIKATPSGYIDVHLKNLSDTILLQEVSRKLDCIIEGPDSNFSKFYRLRIIPREGRNPVTIANSIYETGLFISAEPTFWLEDIQEISYDPLTTDQWGLYHYKTSNNPRLIGILQPMKWLKFYETL